jgi:hypothetical protein
MHKRSPGKQNLRSLSQDDLVQVDGAGAGHFAVGYVAGAVAMGIAMIAVPPPTLSQSPTTKTGVIELQERLYWVNPQSR